MKPIAIACAALLAPTLYAAEPPGKHLFILSGQSNMARFNEKATFVPAIEAEFGKENVTIVKDAQGGQPIQRWYQKWEGPGNDKNKNGDLYDRLMGKVNLAMKDQNFDTVTFLWMQGEANAKNPDLAKPYEQALKGVYEQLCRDLKRDDIFFVIGRISDFGVNDSNEKFKAWGEIRAMQEAIAASDPRCTWVNTDDLNDGIYKGKPQVNGLHYTKEGYELFGKRLAEAAIKFIRQK